MIGRLVLFVSSSENNYYFEYVQTFTNIAKLLPPGGQNIGSHHRPRYNHIYVITRRIITRADCIRQDLEEHHLATHTHDSADLRHCTRDLVTDRLGETVQSGLRKPGRFVSSSRDIVTPDDVPFLQACNSVSCPHIRNY